MSTPAESVQKERKEKVAPLPERGALLLVECFIRDEKMYNSRVNGGSKKGKTPRQQCLEKWQEELALIGLERSTEQISDRIKGDVRFVRALLTDEKAERGKTGGGRAKKSPKLDVARKKLYEHYEGSHTVSGLRGGIETGLSYAIDEMSEDFSSETISDSGHTFPQSPLEAAKSVESTSLVGPSAKQTFSEFVKSRKRRFTPENETTILRNQLLRSELEVAEKRKRNLDREYEDQKAKSELEKKTAQLNYEIAKVQAQNLGIVLANVYETF